MAELRITNDKKDVMTVSKYYDGSVIFTIKNKSKYTPKIGVIHITEKQMEDIINYYLKENETVK